MFQPESAWKVGRIKTYMLTRSGDSVGVFDVYQNGGREG